MLPPCDCIAKTFNNFMKGMTFENQMSRFGGDRQIVFSVMERKRDERCWSKMGDGEIGVKHKNVPYHIQLDVLSKKNVSAPPIFTICITTRSGVSSLSHTKTVGSVGL